MTQKININYFIEIISEVNSAKRINRQELVRNVLDKEQ
jgi:hypothetical protein